MQILQEKINDNFESTKKGPKKALSGPAKFKLSFERVPVRLYFLNFFNNKSSLRLVYKAGVAGQYAQ